MVDTAPPPEAPSVESAVAEEVRGLTAEQVRAVADAIDGGQLDTVDGLVADLHHADYADLIEQLRPEQRQTLVEHIRRTFDPEILAELDETVRGEVVEQLGTATLARAIARLESDDALYLISTLDENRQRQVLYAIPSELRAMLEEHLAFPEESAGRLMERNFVAVPTFWNVGETIDFLRESDDLPSDFYDIFVVDPRHRPVGTVSTSHVLRTKRPVAITEIMAANPATVPASMDQEEVAYLFRQEDLASAPVVDDSGRLIGVITVDDVVDVIHEEVEEDILRLGGVREGDLYADVVHTGMARFSWLFLNLLTALLASLVIGLFEATIQQIVILAVLMPIVASMGGNAGTQTLTVAVRAIAMKDLTPANAARVVGKEMLVGVFNGLLFAVLIGGVAWAWSGSGYVGLVMSAAMVINMVVAGLAGAAIPLGLSRTGIDPAIASGVFLTTVTDVIGFLAFLGLAAWLLL